jgi:hypothetical protein
MRARCSQLLLIVTGLAMVALPAAGSFSGTDVFIASVGRGAGAAGSQWYTTVWAHNPNNTSANVQFFFLARNQANLAPLVYNDTIPPGDTKRYVNAVGLMFGLDDDFGAIRVVSDQSLIVNSRIYSVPAGGQLQDTVGQFFAAVPASFAIGNGQSTQLLGVYKTNPSGSSQLRYNFGFVEATGSACSLKVTVFDELGANVGSRNYSLDEYEVRQRSFASDFAAISTQNARLQVEVMSGAGRVIAFGSSLANSSNDPSTFEMSFSDELISSNGSSEVFHDSTLTGDGTSGSPLGLADDAVTSGKIAGHTITGDDISTSASVRIGRLLSGGDPGASNFGVFGANDGFGVWGSSGSPAWVIPAASIGVVGVSSSGIGAFGFGGTGGVLGRSTTGGYGVMAESNGNGPDAPALLALATSSTGVAIRATASGSEPTVIADAYGSGSIFQGANLGTPRFLVGNDGSVTLFDSGETESVMLDADSGKGSFHEIEVSGHADASLPIAYAFIDEDGSVRAGTSNITSTWDAGSDRYEISIAGENYYYADYVAVVTPSGSALRPRTGSVGGDLLVYLYNDSGDLVQEDFQFVIFKP